MVALFRPHSIKTMVCDTRAHVDKVSLLITPILVGFLIVAGHLLQVHTTGLYRYTTVGAYQPVSYTFPYKQTIIFLSLEVLLT